MSVIETPAHRQVNPAATNFFATEKIEKFLKFGGNPQKFFRYLSIADGFKVLFTSHLVVNIFFFKKNRETFLFL